MATADAANFCAACGEPLTVGARHCRRCGHSVFTTDAGASHTMRARILATVTAAVLGAAVGGAAWYFTGRDKPSTTTALPGGAVAGQVTTEPPTRSGSPAETSTPSETATAASSAENASAALVKRRRADMSRLSTDNRWVVVLASKSDGITDPLQTTRSGSHQFRLADILAEHEALRSQPDIAGDVLLVQGTDFGKRQTRDGKPLWMTLYDGGFTSEDDAADFCLFFYPNLSGDALKNRCIARQLTPPHD